MRNCLSDPKPEFTAALHYRFLQEALGEAQLGKGSPVNSSCACVFHKHVGGFLPGVAGAGGVGARGKLPAVPPKPSPCQFALTQRMEGGRGAR